MFSLWLADASSAKMWRNGSAKISTGWSLVQDDNVALLNLVEELTISHNLRCGRTLNDAG